MPPNGRILDYGCGNGKTIEEGISRNMDICGVEAFSFGSGPDLKQALDKKGLLNDRIFELNGTSMPFPDGYFDMVISNQVFEHVVDMEGALQEITRVLKPGGKLLCLFPSKEVIREGHCGILFAHWLPYSRFRYYWLLLWRSLGFGRLKRNRTKRHWASFFNDWLVDQVSYRSKRDIRVEFGMAFGSIKHLEREYVMFRLEHGRYADFARLAAMPLVGGLSGWLFTKWGGLVFMASKSEVR